MSRHISATRLVSLKRQLPAPDVLKDLLKFQAPAIDRRKARLEAAKDIWDLRAIAQRRTPKGPFDYVDGAAEKELSLQRAREAYDNLAFNPQVLKNVRDVDLSTQLAGAPSAFPLAIAPTGFTRMMHAEGELGGIAAAHRFGIPFTLSTMGTETIEDVAAAGPSGRRWFQLYLWQKNRSKASELIERAAQAGYDTLMVTVDTPVAGARHRDARNGMTFPPKLTPATVINASYRPEWWFNFLTTRPLGFTNFGEGTQSIQQIGSMFDPTLTYKDLSWLRAQWPGQLLVKGVQTAQDALLSVEAGADGVVLSNHGGRQLDRAPVPLYTLPAVREAIGNEPTVLIDTGIMSGADVIAAVALGANGAMIGRAYLYGLMAGGAEGVVRALEIFTQEMTRTVQLLGVSQLSELNSQHVSLDWRAR
ncbi:alpha-hydroxy acid oxidase [Rothia nasimurium]|uniref:alpha-hydroxy acid oxidase n=1 Tax=Rothia nasimurium TaxID=85336 RepID=UPI001F2C2497|nr:alpha-hydroxy acid oxidase [Rothia nasimurium]